jgi:hypothetical protein
VLVVPEEEGEGEQRQVVVRTLEARETGQGDHRQEQLLYVLDHFGR